jgi:protein required for attachment to host cells
MPRTWIVVAESSRARILETNSTQEALREVETLDHPEARLHEQELTSDQPGRRFAVTSEPKRHSMGQPVSQKEEHAHRFSRELANHIEAARVAGKFDRLILAAAPKFLGQLRDDLAAGTVEVLVHQYDKNWIHDDADTIRKHLPEYL